VGNTELEELATAHGVAVRYVDWQQRPVEVDRDVIRAVLGLLDVDAGNARAIRAALAAARHRPRTIVLRQGNRPPRVPAGELRADDGGVREVRDRLPADLAPGWYRLSAGNRGHTVIVAPERLAPPPRSWGWMLQLYALRSAGSWGAGDFADLASFAGWAAASAGAILLNPLHAVAPVRPVPASPYSPTSRRYVNPLYLRVEHTSAYLSAGPAARSTVDSLRPSNDTGFIDYDAVWDAKQRALEVLWQHEKSRPDGDDFATYCALAEEYGPDWRRWPAGLRRPDGDSVAEERAKRADRVAFHAWLQRLCDEQLGAAAKAARRMAVGLIHDLAVGVDPAGADAWMLQDVLAQGVHVGAPPDAFNQRGQDWGLAPWRPDRLAATGYRAYRDLLAATFRHARGVRVDHVAGLWRLWWIPPGASPDQGTYVHYDPDAMLGALTVEAHRTGAVVVGEDLGTVPAKVTRALRARNVLGSTVLWFARAWNRPGAPYVRPAKWPELTLASVSTHDLPTVQGFLTGAHVELRAQAGVLARPVEEETAGAESDLAALRTLLEKEGLADEDPLLAVHELLARSPARLVLASPYDVLGEARQPNLPGTFDEYPNWRIPLPVPLEEFLRDPRTAAVVRLLRRDRAAAVRSRTSASRAG
jgi:4-alpha-glucanotransferase